MYHRHALRAGRVRQLDIPGDNVTDRVNAWNRSFKIRIADQRATRGFWVQSLGKQPADAGAPPGRSQNAVRLGAAFAPLLVGINNR